MANDTIFDVKKNTTVPVRQDDWMTQRAELVKAENENSHSKFDSSKGNNENNSKNSSNLKKSKNNSTNNSNNNKNTNEQENINIHNEANTKNSNYSHNSNNNNSNNSININITINNNDSGHHSINTNNHNNHNKTPQHGEQIQYNAQFNSQQQQQTQMDDSVPRTQSVRKWSYLDPNSNIQGEFVDSQMEIWFEQRYFAKTLPVRRSGETHFATLEQLFGHGDSAFLSKIPDVWPISQETITKDMEGPVQTVNEPTKAPPLAMEDQQPQQQQTQYTDHFHHNGNNNNNSNNHNHNHMQTQSNVLTQEQAYQHQHQHIINESHGNMDNINNIDNNLNNMNMNDMNDISNMNDINDINEINHPTTRGHSLNGNTHNGTDGQIQHEPRTGDEIVAEITLMRQFPGTPDSSPDEDAIDNQPIIPLSDGNPGMMIALRLLLLFIIL